MATLRGMSTKSYNIFVFRQLKWQEIAIDDLLPGDIMSLTAKTADKTDGDTNEETEKAAGGPTQKVMVPCDCLVLKGSAIVNEATLTGESVPQMKDALSVASDGDASVDAFGQHRIHALFSG